MGTIAGVVAAYYGAFVTEMTSHAMTHPIQEFPFDMLFYSFATIFMMSVRGMAFTYAQKRFDNRLGALVYNRIFRQNHEYYHTTPTAGIIDQATNDVRIVSSNIALCINVFSRSTVSTLVTAYLMYNISAKLTGLVVVLIPLSFGLSHAHSKIHLRVMKGRDELCQSISKHIQDTLSHVMLLRMYLAETACMEKHAGLLKQSAQYDVNDMLLYGANVFIMQNMPTLTTLAILVVASRLDMANVDMVTFMFHQQTLQASVRSTVDFVYEYTRCIEPMKRITHILSCPADVVPHSKRGDDSDTLAFQNVSFKYTKDDYVLKNISFTVPPGDKVAFIGRSGMGKSTIAKLLVGMLTPTSGHIQGIDVRDFGYVSQDVVLLHDSIAFNISFGKTHYSRQDIEAAAMAANAHDFISALPNGYDTVLTGTEMGSLSGGEKQRISIARALLRKPRVLVFDEATSALDSESEELVQASIERIAKESDSTVLVIAHRPAAYAFVNTVYRVTKTGIELVRGGGGGGGAAPETEHPKSSTLRRRGGTGTGAGTVF
jgi:ABC-type multidrug transport system fused ATPase/permease subunit